MLPDLNSLLYFPPLELSLFGYAAGRGRPGQLLTGHSEMQLGEYALPDVEFIFRPDNACRGVWAHGWGARRVWRRVYLEDGRIGGADMKRRR